MFRKITVFVKTKLRKSFKNIFSKSDISYLKNKNFVIVSDNCWGGSLYQWYKRPYNSPFVGLFIHGPCYIKMLTNFKFYLEQDLSFIQHSKYPDITKKYPIGLLDDVEIHFEHYETEDEAKDKWKRRTSRMLEETNLDNYFFTICDREHVSKSHIITFHELDFKNKVSFAVNDYQELETRNHIKVLETDKRKRDIVPNGKKMFRLTFLYFNLNEWLLNGSFNKIK